MKLNRKYLIQRTSEKLKACPTCGKYEAVIIGNGAGVEVVCGNPDCHDMREGGWTESFAEALWNKRPIEDDLCTKLACKEENVEFVIRFLEDFCKIFNITEERLASIHFLIDHLLEKEEI